MRIDRTIAVATALDMLRSMHVIRRFDEAAMAHNLAGDIRGSVHPYIGQEGIATGVCAALQEKDFIASYHRGHGHTLAKGGDPVSMMAELFGKATGMCRGKAGSLHVADIAKGVLGANGIVGDGATLAIGAAHSARLLGTGAVAVPFFGDGAINRGPVLEAMNWAQAFTMPVVFVCEDNVYSYTVRTSDVTGGPGAAARAAGFGLEVRSVDGNDAVAVYMSARELVDRARAGHGPGFLYATTYRPNGHIAKDKGPYRPTGEAVRFAATDPIPRLVGWLLEHGVDAAKLAAIEADAVALIERAVVEAIAAPDPDPSELMTDTLDVGEMA